MASAGPGTDGRINKLPPKLWLEIVNLVTEGMRSAEIAAKYEVSTSAIYAGLKKRYVDLNAVQARVTREENDRLLKETKTKSLYRNGIVTNLSGAEVAGPT